MIISITGATSNVGKTTLIEHLLRELRGSWGVCKVTVCRSDEPHRCPHGKDDSCGVCNEDLETFIAETSEETLREPGKDTWRYYEAGADNVVWLRTRPEYLAMGIHEALKLLDGGDGIIFEGNNVLLALDPDLAVMAVGNPVRYKASAKKILDKIDISGEASDPVLIDKIVSAVYAPK